MSKYKVFSMFDGVGGFIVSLNNANKYLNTNFYEVTHSNQYEPSRKSQDAYQVGKYNFPNIKHNNQDITNISNEYFDELKANNVNMIVGGFPCQDYSVARSKKHELGIEGKKGVLFWEIIRAVEHIDPDYLILENVDRLLKAPSKQRGRDFAVMLAAFNQLNYSVEWRVINAAEYGCSQRRRRVFILVYKNTTPIALDNEINKDNYQDYLLHNSVFSKQFPVKDTVNKKRESYAKLSDSDDNSDTYILNVSDNFEGRFWNSGVMKNGKYYTIDTIPELEEPKTLGTVITEAKQYYEATYGKDSYSDYLENFIIKDKNKIEKFEYLRGPKKIKRTSPDGHEWTYAEGGMSAHDDLNLPARTMLTSEGSVNRSTHFIKYNDTFRLLTPIEAELLQGFTPEWTKYKINDKNEIEVVSNRMRMFFMGNALVTDIVKRIAIQLAEEIISSSK